MPIEHDDWRLTAYALGELEPGERAELEILIAEDPEALASINEIQATATLLANHLQAEATPGLAPENRQAIETHLETSATTPISSPPKVRRNWARYAIAAGLLALSGTLLYPSIRQSIEPDRVLQLALNEPAAVPAPAPETNLRSILKAEAAAEPQDATLIKTRPELPEQLSDAKDLSKAPAEDQIRKKKEMAAGEKDAKQDVADQPADPRAMNRVYVQANPEPNPAEAGQVAQMGARPAEPAPPRRFFAPPATPPPDGYLANPFLDNSLGNNRNPIVVGTLPGGVANYSDSLGAPTGQAGGFAGGGGGTGAGGPGKSNAANPGGASAGMRGKMGELAQKPGQDRSRDARSNSQQPGLGQQAGQAQQPGQGQQQSGQNPQSGKGQQPGQKNQIQYETEPPTLQAYARPAAESEKKESVRRSTLGLASAGRPLSEILPPGGAGNNFFGMPANGLQTEIENLDREISRVTEIAKRAAIDTKTITDLIERRRMLQQQLDQGQGGDAFNRIVDNAFLRVEANPLSTFSIDVDTASYANVRRYLNSNTRPPADSVRIEELVNYFPYSYPQPKGDDPFSVNLEVARCPWNSTNRLVRIGLKGREIDNAKRPLSNLVFLIDVSGSMNQPDKLPLLKAGMKLLVDHLGENDRVAIVVYAGSEGLALSSTNCSQKERILSALEELQAGGSTNGGRGIQLAYDIAVQNFIKGGTNRVILATDGDFNVGVTEGPALDHLIEEKRTTGVFLSVLGFGQGNVKHDKLENLADKGNGQYSFIDTIKEARKVLGEQISGTLVTIAKDVKIQVKFNPLKAASYRLIGYENRVLQAQDFANDKKDAGEIGAGHCVTAFYEVVPTGGPGPDSAPIALPAAESPELLNVDLRYKAPDGDISKLISFPATDLGRDFSAASSDYRFASSVAGFGMLLRNSPYKGTLTWTGLTEMARASVDDETTGYRKEFLELIGKAQGLEPRRE